jgi:predicted transcriptional regulator
MRLEALFGVLPRNFTRIIMKAAATGSGIYRKLIRFSEINAGNVNMSKASEKCP